MSDSEEALVEAWFAPRLLGEDDGQATYIGLLEKIEQDPPAVKKRTRPSKKSTSTPNSTTKEQSTVSPSAVASTFKIAPTTPSLDELPPLAQQKRARPASDEEEASAGAEGKGKRLGDGDSVVLEEIKFAPESDEKKPDPTYFSLLKHALLFSPQKKLTLTQIYEALEGRWPWFSKAGKGWKNTVRNNLSLGPSFQKANGGLLGKEAERGTYWTFDSDALEGCPRYERNKRTRTTKTDEDTFGLYNKSRGRRKSSPSFSDAEEGPCSRPSMPGISEVDNEGCFKVKEDIFDSGTERKSAEEGREPVYTSWNVANGSLVPDRPRPITIPPPASPYFQTPSSGYSRSPSSSLPPLPSPIAWGALSRPESSFDPDDRSLSLFSTPLSAGFPLLSPPSASNSYSSLESWHSADSAVGTCLRGSDSFVGLSNMDEQQQVKSTFHSSSYSLPSKLCLHYPSHPLDSPSNEFALRLSSTSEAPTTHFSDASRDSTKSLPPIPFFQSDPQRTSHQKQHEPSPLQKVHLSTGSAFSLAQPPAPRRLPLRLEDTPMVEGFPSPRFERDAALFATLGYGGSAPGLGLVGLDGNEGDEEIEPAGMTFEPEQEHAELDSTQGDLSNMLSGRTPEFWQGLWAGWNASSSTVEQHAA